MTRHHEKIAKLAAVNLALVLLAGCANKTFDSACHELSVKSKTELRSMQRSATRARFERHVALLETGSGMASQCQSYFISGDDYRGLPDSMYERCLNQGFNGVQGYCLLYWVDGERVEEMVSAP